MPQSRSQRLFAVRLAPGPDFFFSQSGKSTCAYISLLSIVPVTIQ